MPGRLWTRPAGTRPAVDPAGCGPGRLWTGRLWTGPEVSHLEPSLAPCPSPPPRQWPEPVAAEEFRIAAPPAAADEEPQGRLAALLPAAGSLGMVAFALLSGSMTFLVLSGVLVLVGCGVPLLSLRQRRQWRARREAARRSRYVSYLEQTEARLARAHLAQQRHAQALYPPWPVSRDAARRGHHWLRRPGDLDFGVVRVGTGRVPSVSRVTAEAVPVDADGSDGLAASARSLAARYSAVDDMPVTVDVVRGFTVLRACPGQEVSPGARPPTPLRRSFSCTTQTTLTSLCLYPQLRPVTTNGAGARRMCRACTSAAWPRYPRRASISTDWMPRDRGTRPDTA